jgi:hypothetical protein
LVGSPAPNFGEVDFRTQACESVTHRLGGRHLPLHQCPASDFTLKGFLNLGIESQNSSIDDKGYSFSLNYYKNMEKKAVKIACLCPV